MNTIKPNIDPTRTLVMAASLVVLIAGMRAAATILVPFLVSAFLALICAPLVYWLRRKGVPSFIAVIFVVFLLLSIGVSIGALVGTTLGDFYRALPGYQSRLQEQTLDFLAWLQDRGVNIPEDQINDIINPGAVMQMVAVVLKGLGSVLTGTVLILLTAIFILLEASTFTGKLRAALGDPEASFSRLDEITANVNRYLAIKTIISLITGLTVTLWVSILNVDFALLWGLLAFLLNYVPNIGSLLAAVPAVLIGFVQYGFGPALIIGAGYLVINFVFGNLIEPRYMGRGLGLSTLVVFLSLVFWGWVLGPVGMLFSVPLTMALKIALGTHEETRWISILLGQEIRVKTEDTPQDQDRTEDTF